MKKLNLEVKELVKGMIPVLLILALISALVAWVTNIQFVQAFAITLLGIAGLLDWKAKKEQQARQIEENALQNIVQHLYERAYVATASVSWIRELFVAKSLSDIECMWEFDKTGNKATVLMCFKTMGRAPVPIDRMKILQQIMQADFANLLLGSGYKINVQMPFFDQYLLQVRIEVWR